MSDSSEKQGLDLAKREDREKLAGIVRAEFGISVSHDDPLFVFLRLYQYTATAGIEALLARLLEEKDSFGDLIEHHDKELARQFAVIISAISDHANKTFAGKEAELRGISDDLVKRIDTVVNGRLDNISTQLQARIDVNKSGNRLYFILATLGAGSFFSAIIITALTAILHHA